MRPASVKKFEILYLGSLIIGLVGTFMTWNDIIAAFQSGVGTALSRNILIAVIVVIYAISLLLWYLTARRASNIAKWILVVLTLFSLIGLPALFVGPFDLSKGVGLLSTLLGVAAMIFLFLPDARIWFGGDRADDPDALNETFE